MAEDKHIPLPQPGAPPPEPDAPAPEPTHIEDTAADEAPAAGKVFADDVVEALREVRDPEIPVNIYDLGLIYDIEISDDNDVNVKMTLTTPNCPEAQSIPKRVQEAVHQRAPAARKVSIDLVWEPRWTPEMMSEDAKLALDMF